MAATSAAATPAAAIGSLFDSYNAQGGDNGLFAPAYVPGYQPSSDALAAYNAQMHPVNIDQAQALSMPNAWQPPPQPRSSAYGIYGAGNIPTSQTFSASQGIADPAALRAAAQGGSYDVAARRAAIAAQLQTNAAAAASYVPSVNPYGVLGSK